jgi:hypothetical protein
LEELDHRIELSSFEALDHRSHGGLTFSEDSDAALIEVDLLVKGAAIDASAKLKEIPMSAAFKASQSFAPSPHIPTFAPLSERRLLMSNILSSGDILAYTCALVRTDLNRKGS